MPKLVTDAFLLVISVLIINLTQQLIETCNIFFLRKKIRVVGESPTNIIRAHKKGNCTLTLERLTCEIRGKKVKVVKMAILTTIRKLK